MNYTKNNTYPWHLLYTYKYFQQCILTTHWPHTDNNYCAYIQFTLYTYIVHHVYNISLTWLVPCPPCYRESPIVQTPLCNTKDSQTTVHHNYPRDCHSKQSVTYVWSKSRGYDVRTCREHLLLCEDTSYNTCTYMENLLGRSKLSRIFKCYWLTPLHYHVTHHPTLLLAQLVEWCRQVLLPSGGGPGPRWTYWSVGEDVGGRSVPWVWVSVRGTLIVIFSPWMYCMHR